jgi:hypothetical protein
MPIVMAFKWRLNVVPWIPSKQLTYEVVDAELHRDSQFGTNPISATYKHGIFVSSGFEVEHATETSNLPVGTWSAR